jgi:hypothetical protein
MYLVTGKTGSGSLLAWFMVLLAVTLVFAVPLLALAWFPLAHAVPKLISVGQDTNKVIEGHIGDVLIVAPFTLPVLGNIGTELKTTGTPALHYIGQSYLPGTDREGEQVTRTLFYQFIKPGTGKFTVYLVKEGEGKLEDFKLTYTIKCVK